MTRLRRWLWEHSLSLALGVVTLVGMSASAVCEAGWWRDAWMTLGGGAATSLILLLARTRTWEKGATAEDKPPR